MSTQLWNGIRPLQKDDVVEAQDRRGHWYEARVVCVESKEDGEGNRRDAVRVRFRGWSERFAERVGYERIRVMPHNWREDITKGSKIEALVDVSNDNDRPSKRRRLWHVAVVDERRGEKIRFTFCNSNVTEWIRCESENICPLHTHIRTDLATNTTGESSRALSDTSETKKEPWRTVHPISQFYVVKTRRDGNCLFRALASHDDQNRTHVQMRCDLMNWIWKNRCNLDSMSLFEWLTIPDQQPPGFEIPRDREEAEKTYISFMKEDGNWGGQIEIIAASKVMAKNIVVLTRHDAASYEEYFRTSIVPSYPTIYLLYSGQSHYSETHRH